jgi:ribosome maturation factor RimP
MLTPELQKIIESTVLSLGYELYGCEWQPLKGRGVLRIYIDTPNGVTLDDCTIVNRQLSAVFDVEDIASGGYYLEVSSPGLDRSLFRLEHYQQLIGRKVKIKLRTAINNRRNFAGVIKGVESDEIVVRLDDGSEEIVMLPFDEIEKANLVPEL